MKKSIFIAAMTAISMSSAFASYDTGAVTCKLPKGVKPVKENGTYVMPSQEKEENELLKGLQIPSKKGIRNEVPSGNIAFTLDSIIGRRENGDYTVKETYRYDNNGNSKEACYYNWDSNSNDWDMYKHVVANWDSNNNMTQIDEFSFSPWGDSGSRIIYVFEGNLNTEAEMYVQENGEWIGTQRSYYKFDANGNMIEEIIQTPDGNGGWINNQKNVAEWNAMGLRTLAETYAWNGAEWVPGDTRFVYEFDDAGRFTLFLNDLNVNGEWQHFERIIQKWCDFGLTYQTYEFWNNDREDWSGNSMMPSSYATMEYDEKGRNVLEIGYIYDRDIDEWVKAKVIEQAYTDLDNGNTRVIMESYNEEDKIILETIDREYNQAGNDVYWKQSARMSANSPLLPLGEKFTKYDESGTVITEAEEYQFIGDERYASIKLKHVYDENGDPVESWSQLGEFLETGEGEPESWINYSYFKYEYENGAELSRMCYLWQDDEYVGNWGEGKSFDFNVPINDCIFWMNADVNANYMITETRVYTPVGKDWTYEEGTWYYSELETVDVDSVEATAMKVYPNPAADDITVEAENGSVVNIYSMQGVVVISTTQHTIDVSNLTNGIYIVNVDGKSSRLIKK